jgi:tRNA(Ile)-lysidine synthase
MLKELNSNFFSSFHKTQTYLQEAQSDGRRCFDYDLPASGNKEEDTIYFDLKKLQKHSIQFQPICTNG